MMDKHIKYKSSMFCEDTCKLSIRDIVSLVIGKEIKIGPLIIGLYKMPRNYADSLINP
jgi:hypothetical protein